MTTQPNHGPPGGPTDPPPPSGGGPHGPPPADHQTGPTRRGPALSALRLICRDPLILCRQFIRPIPHRFVRRASLFEEVTFAWPPGVRNALLIRGWGMFPLGRRRRA